MLDRPRQQRRGAGGIHRQQRAGLMGDLRRARDVGDGPERVGRRLRPDQLRLARPDGFAQRIEVGHVHQRDPQAPARAVGQQPVAQGPIHDVRRHHMIARRQREEHRGRGRHAGAQQQRGRCVLQHGDHRFGLAHRLVVGAAVDVTGTVLVVRVAEEGGGAFGGVHAHAPVASGVPPRMLHVARRCARSEAAARGFRWSPSSPPAPCCRKAGLRTC